MTDNRDFNQTTLSNAIKTVFKQYGIDDKLEELKIQPIWEEMMGKEIARRTTGLMLKKGELRIQINSATLRNELMMAREKIARSLNEKLGKPLIREVFFH